MADNENKLCEKGLFGGAITCFLPVHCIDASTIREVADHQEVFCHKESDQSIIIDILEYQEQAKGEEGPRYHFLDIAEANEALSTSNIALIEQIPKDYISLSESQEAWYLNGTQTVSKFNEEAGNIIQVYLALFRLPQFGTDLVITMNNPVQLSTQSSSYQQGNCETNELWTENTFKYIVNSIKILDTGLFG
ncbi:ran guanine nucleotide release factor-like [Rhopilema esculentum]|uniref:ran guanine nucleotide release factor-like n=1 Tax=Rhopilema esculentum TaxID=499914 RepID=UPI0031DD0C69